MQGLILALAGAAAASSGLAVTPIGPQCMQTSFPVPNGDFESGSLHPWTIGTDGRPGKPNITIVASSRGSSQYVVQLSANGTTGDELRQYNITTYRAYNFTVSFDYRFTKTASDCILGVTASHAEYNQFISFPSNQTEWTTESFVYTDYLYDTVELSARMDCPDDGDAVVQLDNFQLTRGPSLEPAGCPKAVRLQNGGFESGALAPWTQPSNGIHNVADYGIISPGHGPNSNYLYQVEFPTTNYSVIGLSHPVHNLCLGYNYTVSFDINWGNYTAPSPRPNGCRLYNGLEHLIFRNPNINAPPNIYPPKNPVGWQPFKFTAQAIHRSGSTLDLQIVCDAQFGHEGPYPPINAFTFQLDNVQITLTEQ